MHGIRSLFLLYALCCLALACGGGQPEEPYESPPPAATAGDEVSEPMDVAASEPTGPQPTPPPVAEPEPAANAAEPPPPPMPTAGAVITLKVKDYDAWKQAFDAGEAMRIKGGAIGHSISRSANNEATVTVYLATTDLPALEKFVTSKERKKAMKAAGVKGKEKVTFMTHSESKPAQDSASAAMITHQVKDFEAWKQAFDGNAEAREQAGITGYGISQDPKKPNLVHVYLQADDVDTLRTFIDSEDRKTAMKEAGIKGKPKVAYMTQEEMKFYPPQAAATPEPETTEAEQAPSEQPAPAPEPQPES